MKRSAVLVMVLVFGVWLRWYGIDWALPLMFHPDETRLLYAVSDIFMGQSESKIFCVWFAADLFPQSCACRYSIGGGMAWKAGVGKFFSWLAERYRPCLVRLRFSCFIYLPNEAFPSESRS